VAIATEGAVILREYRADYTNKVLYRRQCDECGYVARGAPIPVLCEPYGTRMHGCYHRENSVCPVCGNRQAVSIQGGG
jgi:anaerobic ribonucleoside-triphosphate reductase